jgi:hypothetical protein
VPACSFAFCGNLLLQLDELGVHLGKSLVDSCESLVDFRELLVDFRELLVHLLFQVAEPHVFQILPSSPSVEAPLCTETTGCRIQPLLRALAAQQPIDLRWAA